MPAGFLITSEAMVVANDPKHGLATPKTSSPISNPATPIPIFEILPEQSHPRPAGGSPSDNMPSDTITSLKLSPTASTSISTSPGAGLLRPVALNKSVSGAPGVDASNLNGSPGPASRVSLPDRLPV